MIPTGSRKIVVNVVANTDSIHEKFWMHPDHGTEEVPRGQEHDDAPPGGFRFAEEAGDNGWFRGAEMKDHAYFDGTSGFSSLHSMKYEIAPRITRVLKNRGRVDVDTPDGNPITIRTGLQHTKFWDKVSKKADEENPTENAIGFSGHHWLEGAAVE